MPKHLALPTTLAFLLAAMTTAPCRAGEAGRALGALRYAGGLKVFQTGVYQPRLLDELPNGDAEPFLVMSGLGCDECDINRSVYIHSPAQGPMALRERAARYTFPGEYRNYLSGERVKSVRMFSGRCTADKGPGVLWLQRVKLETGAWLSTAYIVQIADGQLVDRADPAYEAVLKIARHAVARGGCREVRGLRFNTEP